jgi:lipoprotein-anchoring transpeptidase ErfK/SrfK
VIAQMNNISDPNRVYSGQQLIIPAANGTGGVTDFGILEVPAGPGATIATGRQIVVDLSDSRAYAYENGQLLYSALGSTGLPATPTVQGDYKVYSKIASQTMSGPGYYLPGVPWILYFYQGYSLHGTYWHNNFGQPMSHGCVNLRTEDALWFYEFAEVGTPVHVQW